VGLAVIVPKEGERISEEDVIAHCQANLARYKAPMAARFMDHLPRNAAGKVLKHVLRDQFAGAS
jgi:fatty-acyl-CoA synthase